MTLTEFLLERIATEEAAAKAALSARTTWATAADHAAQVAGADAGLFILFNSPRHVLAECEAKRRVVAAHPVALDRYHPEAGYCEICQTWDGGGVSRTDVQAPCETLAALALPYADHPDYRETWRP